MKIKMFIIFFAMQKRSLFKKGKCMKIKYTSFIYFWHKLGKIQYNPELCNLMISENYINVIKSVIIKNLLEICDVLWKFMIFLYK